jgi:phosphatidylglycerophosphate synthase
MFDDAFRARFQPAVQPLVVWLARAGVTPNAVTLTTFVVALLGAIIVATVDPRAGVVVWLISRVGDGLDGALARVSGLSSAFGGFLDITVDMAAYSAMVLAFAVVHPEYAMGWMAVLAGYVIVITTTLALSDAARASGAHLGATDRTFQFTRGITEAGETNVAYVIWAFLPAWLPWAIWLWAAALLVTGAQRMILARRTL